MNTRSIRVRIGLVAVLCCWASMARPSSGGIITYANRALWEAAATTTITDEDLNSVTSDIVLTGGGSASLKNMTISRTGAPTLFLVDTPPYVGGFGNTGIDGTTDLFFFGNASSGYRIDFTQQVTGFAYDRVNFPGTLNLLDESDSVIGTVSSGGVAAGFVGFHTDAGEEIHAIEYTHSGNDNGFLDNIAFTAVPEPSACGLLGLVGINFVCSRRRRRRAA